MAQFNWKEAWQKAETVEFSKTTVTADGREFPGFVRDGFGTVFKFKSAGVFVTFEKVDEPFCFKVFTPDMVVRNVGREIFEKAERGEVSKKVAK